jgi:hypothetical protein
MQPRWYATRPEPPLEMSTPVTLDLNATSNGRVVLDGHDVSHCVCGVEVTAWVGELTRVTLHLVNNTFLLNAPAEVRALLAPLPASGLIEDETTIVDSIRRWRRRNVPDYQ